MKFIKFNRNEEVIMLNLENVVYYSYQNGVLEIVLVNQENMFFNDEQAILIRDKLDSAIMGIDL